MKGVFLYLGYSRRDEELLLPQTRESMHDAIPRLESIIARHARNKVRLVPQSFMSFYVLFQSIFKALFYLIHR